MNIEDCPHPDCVNAVNPPYPFICDHDEPKMQRAYTQPEDVAFTYESARQAAIDARRRWREQRDQPCYCLTCEVHRNGLVEGLRPFVPPWALKLIEEDLARQADGEDVPEK